MRPVSTVTTFSRPICTGAGADAAAGGLRLSAASGHHAGGHDNDSDHRTQVTHVIELPLVRPVVPPRSETVVVAAAGKAPAVAPASCRGLRLPLHRCSQLAGWAAAPPAPVPPAGRAPPAPDSPRPAVTATGRRSTRAAWRGRPGIALVQSRARARPAAPYPMWPPKRPEPPPARPTSIACRDPTAPPSAAAGWRACSMSARATISSPFWRPPVKRGMVTDAPTDQLLRLKAGSNTSTDTRCGCSWTSG